MANKKHLAKLKRGIEVWNEWRNINVDIKPDLSEADLRIADLRMADLRMADLRMADLSYAKLSEANLSYAELRQANLSEANLSYAKLSEANLSYAELRQANLSESDLSEANLSEACFLANQALATNFQGANLTGACIEDWNINSQTNLNNVICDYIYLKRNQQERRPHDPNQNFAPGEFTQLFQQALETVDLIFSDGIDWNAFLTSFKELQDKYGEENVGVQALEKKSDPTFVVRIEVPPDADKAIIEKSFWQKYKLILEAKDEQIAFYQNEIECKRQENTELLGIVKTMAEKESSKVNMSFHAPVNGVAGNVEGNQNIYAPEQKQTLAEAAAEIQQLLTQLQSQGCSQEEAQQQAANDLATKAKDNPTTLGKLVKWGQSLGDTAAQTTVSEAAKEVVKLALRLSGVSLP